MPKPLFTISFMLILFTASFTSTSRAQESPFERGDNVVYIGNTLADRMQHHAWLETYIHALHPNHELTFRNLGFSGDEVNVRQRADNFGDADQWLAKCKADVVACFFGYNEALKGERNVSQFGKDLAEMLGHMKSTSYNGTSPPRIFVFSPIAHENLNSPHLPDGSKNNRNLELYTDVMRKVCESQQVPFVDIFSITKRLYESSDEPLTMNGIHLLDRGNRLLAREIVKAFAPNETLPSDDDIAKLRDAVLDKNYHWFSRYRVVDEYNVFGGRSKLAWFGQSNADVMMREMEIFEVMTSNRDKRIWAVAEGGDLEIADDNLPETLSVRPNRKGPLEDGAFPYLGGEEAIEKMKVGEGLEVNLFASEEQFPRLVNPVQMAVDTDSRLWASVWPSYPHWNPTEARQDALVILPDEDGDGKADELIVFADELNSITGFEFWGGGVLVAAPPEIWFLKDTDGDDKADYKLRVLQGVSSADTHHSANAMVIGPDGWLYWSRGIFNVAAFETPTQTYRSGQSGVHRFNPRTFEMEFHYPIGPNPHGDVFDRWGFQFANDGTSGTGGYVGIGKGQRPGNRQWFKKEWRPVAATGILSSEHFPDSFQNDFLICNTIGFLGILRYNVEYDGATITAVRTEDVLQSSDENFRPSDVEIGGDGALYVADWHNVLIGHMQHNMRDPNRDHSHGRIYRVTAKGGQPLTPIKMKNKPISDVLPNLFSNTNSVRYRTRLELSSRPTEEVLKAVSSFTTSLDPSKAAAERNEAQALLECLWIHEEHRVANVTLVEKAYQASDPRVRAAAIRTLGHWPDAENWQTVLALAAQDQAAIVRAEAVKAAVNFSGLEVAEIIFEVANRPTDPELADVINFAMKEVDLNGMIEEAIAQRKSLSAAAKTYALKNSAADLLLKMEKSAEVYRAIVTRENVDPKYRWEAIEFLDSGAGRSRFQQIYSTLIRGEREKYASLPELAQLLANISVEQLRGTDRALRTLVERTESTDVRRAAYAAWVRSGKGSAAWNHALQAKTNALSILDAVAGLQSPEKEAPEVFALARELMLVLPEHLDSDGEQQASSSGPAVSFEYFAPNPSNVTNETLDSLKPRFVGSMSDFNKYVRGGKADGFATRQSASILIPSGGRYTFYTTSDDGSRLYIDGEEVVNNDGLHGMSQASGEIRLDAGLHEITVNYFENGGGDGLVVSWKGPNFDKQKIPPSALRPSGGGSLRKRALDVVASWPGHIDQKIADFSMLASGEDLSESSLRALASLPPAKVGEGISSDYVAPLLEKVFQKADQVTPAEKQLSEFANLLALGNGLATRIKSEEASLRLAALKSSIPVRADPEIMKLGAEVYARESHCATCHQPHGQGLPNLYPPIDGSLWATGSEDRLIRLVLDGMHGTIEVKGKRYSSPPLPPMTGFRHLLDDKEIAAVLTYVRNSWTNRAQPIDVQTVSSLRAIERGNEAVFWNANELMGLYPLEDGRKPVEQASSDGWIPKLVQEWKLTDFPEDSLRTKGRSHSSGALWFSRIGCAQCHKLGDEGGVFGPDLAKLEPKKKTANYILESMLDPSKDVEEKYAVKTFLLDSGKVVSGFVVKETDEEYQLKSDPLNQDEAAIVLKDEIEVESSNGKSVMPQGLLNWLTKEQILDLIAYVQAGGDPNDTIYQK